MTARREAWGQTRDGVDVTLWTLEAGNVRARVTDYGARLVSLEAPDSEGRRGEITLGYEDLADYETSPGYLGCTVGRWANRIAGSRFALDGQEFALDPNEGDHQLHGGPRGFDRHVWRPDPVPGDLAAVAFTLLSPNGDQGFPGALSCRVVYRLTSRGELVLEYDAESDAPTVVNLTHHSYWNLAGGGDVLDHQFEILCDDFFPVDTHKIPTGDRRSVAGTSLDFRRPKSLRSGVEMPDSFVREAGGYDHCFELRPSLPGLVLAARVREPRSGRTLAVTTTESAVQLYGGAGLADEPGRGGRRHGPGAGFCLETQRPPDAPNQPRLGAAILRPGRVYHQETRYRFGVDAHALEARTEKQESRGPPRPEWPPPDSFPVSVPVR